MRERVRRVLAAVLRFVHDERALVVATLLIIAGLWAFVGIYDEMAEGEVQQFDFWVSRLLRPGPNAEPVGPHWMVTAAIDLTALGSTSVLVLLIALVAGYLMVIRRLPLLWLMLAASVLGSVLNLALKAIIGRDRPDHALHLVEVSHASFPSGHAMLSTTVYLVLGAVVAATRTRRRERAYILAAALLIAGIVGLTRVYLGVHYATDVLAGWSLGLCWAVLCLIVAYKLTRRRRALASKQST